MTIGNVVWVDSRKMDLLKRPMVLLVDNLAGFNLDPFKLSVVLIEAMRNGKKRFFAGFWSRGFGNAVHDVGGTATFDDIAVGGISQAAIHLANPFPLGFPSAKENTPTCRSIGTISVSVQVGRPTRNPRPPSCAITGSQ